MTIIASCFRAPLNRRILLLCPIAFLATPALADHLGPGTIGGEGLAVTSPWTEHQGRGALALRLVFTRPEQRPDSSLERLGAAHVHAHASDYVLNGSIGAAYGVTDRLTVSAELPYVRRDDLRQAEHSHQAGQPVNGVERLGNVSGFGDVSLIAKYRLTHSGEFAVAAIAGLKLPSGSTHRKSADGERLETEHQPGSGSLDPILGIAAETRFGTLGLAASALYQVSEPGAQKTRLGNRLQGGFVLSRHFGAVPDEEFRAHDHVHARNADDQRNHARQSSADIFLEIGGEWEGRQSVAGEIEQASGGSWIYAAPGLHLTSAIGWSIGAALALPLWQHIRPSHPRNLYRAMISLGQAL